VELAGVPSGLQSQAYSITPSGRIVGQVFNDDFSLQRAVFWQNANSVLVYLTQLGSAFPHSVATVINDEGNILGDGCDADFVECHAAYWASSTSAPVALASPGGQFIYTDIDFGKNINNAGNMVGVAYNADYTLSRGVYWASRTNPAVVLSVNSSEFTNAIAESINEKREIVGGANNADFTEVHAFLWPSPTSPGIDLNTLIPADSGWTLTDAYDINNRGEIIGRGELNGINHAYLLTPIP
jgi:probable HAF family extracellular repeat protein